MAKGVTSTNGLVVLPTDVTVTGTFTGAYDVVEIEPYTSPANVTANVQGTDTGGGSSNLDGQLDDSGMGIINISIPSPSAGDLLLLEDGPGTYAFTMDDDVATGPPTPGTITTGVPGEGLKFEFDFSLWNLDDIIAALNTWGAANLSGAPATIATLHPDQPDGSSNLMDPGPITHSLSLAAGLSNVFQLNETLPNEQVMYQFNSNESQSTTAAAMGAASPGFGFGVRANGPGLPGSGIEFHKHVSGGEPINGVQYGTVGALFLCGPGSTMQDLLDAISINSIISGATLLTGSPTDLCSDVFEETDPTAAELDGAHHALFPDFFSNGGTRYRRYIQAELGSKTARIELFPPSTYIRV